MRVPTLEEARRANAATDDLLATLRRLMTPEEQRDFDRFVERINAPTASQGRIR